MRVRVVRPCSEVPGKVIVSIYVGHTLDPKQLCIDLKRINPLRRAVFFEKQNLTWIASNDKKIMVRESGHVIVSGVESVDEALKICKQLTLI